MGSALNIANLAAYSIYFSFFSLWANFQSSIAVIFANRSEHPLIINLSGALFIICKSAIIAIGDFALAE